MSELEMSGIFNMSLLIYHFAELDFSLTILVVDISNEYINECPYMYMYMYDACEECLLLYKLYFKHPGMLAIRFGKICVSNSIYTKLIVTSTLMVSLFRVIAPAPSIPRIARQPL